MLARISLALSLGALLVSGCDGSSDGTPTDAGPGTGMDAGIADGAAPMDATPDLDGGPTAEMVLELATPATQASMVATAIAALLPEIASDERVAALYGLRVVPHGDARDLAVGVSDSSMGDCPGGAGTELLSQCPAVISCMNGLTILHWGDGCTATSSRRMRGFVRLEPPLLPALPWRWNFAVQFQSGQGDAAAISVTGALRMTRSGSDLVFNATDSPLDVRIPTDRLDATMRGFGVTLDTITLQQDATGNYSVLGPHTYLMSSVPVRCPGDAGVMTTVSLSVEDCGGWAWPVPISSCICPVAGELRVTGPLLTACTTPTLLQTLTVQFAPITATRACGANMTAVLYTPSTQCAAGCGMCNRGFCLGSLCTSSVDVSGVIGGMVGWLCTLPQTICGGLADAGLAGCPDGGVPRPDGAVPLDDAGPPRDGSADLLRDSSMDLFPDAG